MKADSRHVRTVSPSPNFGERQGGCIDALILHYTGMPTGALARTRLIDPVSQVSCHYLVWDDGRIEQLVAEADRAWHAGRSCWAGERDMNSVSVGIEIVNSGHEGGCPPYPASQIDSVMALSEDICRRHRIRPERVLGHSDVAPERKRDPGEWFPWERLAGAGIARKIPAVRDSRSAAGPDPASRAIIDAQSLLRGIGYDCPESGDLDAMTRSNITAFHRRYRPTRIDGQLDQETWALLDRLR